jgi:hypothetical protein
MNFSHYIRILFLIGVVFLVIGILRMRSARDGGIQGEMPVVAGLLMVTVFGLLVGCDGSPWISGRFEIWPKMH